MTQEGRSILVVDDDQDIREVLELVLGARGYRVWGVGDGQRALEHLRSHTPPDLLIVDLMMPNLDGEELVSRLKRDPSLAAVPVVIVSGDTSARAKAAAVDADACLLKPVELPELLAVVRRFAPANGASRA